MKIRICRDIDKSGSAEAFGIITNNGKKDYTGLKLTEYVPDGTELVSADSAGAVASDGKSVGWTLNIAAGS